MRQRTPAEHAYVIIARQVAGTSTEQVAAILRPPPQRYQAHARAGAKVLIDSLVQQDKANVQGIYRIVASLDAGNTVGVRRIDERRGGLCYAWIGLRHPSVS
ncbi:hypothetical protein EPH_0068680 [Eimeria praecox]|uniref:Uncharacterized protein n=1 Tax=Eimeria praecox TaxID=51316 RepID=U6H2P4_9EIME|nr:hypothetical protein EPH_0068680 [Eimeria praecox]